MPESISAFNLTEKYISPCNFLSYLLSTLGKIWSYFPKLNFQFCFFLIVLLQNPSIIRKYWHENICIVTLSIFLLNICVALSISVSKSTLSISVLWPSYEFYKCVAISTILLKRIIIHHISFYSSTSQPPICRKASRVSPRGKWGNLKEQ